MILLESRSLHKYDNINESIGSNIKAFMNWVSTQISKIIKWIKDFFKSKKKSKKGVAGVGTEVTLIKLSYLDTLKDNFDELRQFNEDMLSNLSSGRFRKVFSMILTPHLEDNLKEMFRGIKSGELLEKIIVDDFNTVKYENISKWLDGCIESTLESLSEIKDTVKRISLAHGDGKVTKEEYDHMRTLFTHTVSINTKVTKRMSMVYSYLKVDSVDQNDTFTDNTIFVNKVKAKDHFAVKSILVDMIQRSRGDLGLLNPAINYATAKGAFKWEVDDNDDLSMKFKDITEEYNYIKEKLVQNFSKERFDKVIKLCHKLYRK